MKRIALFICILLLFQALAGCAEIREQPTKQEWTSETEASSLQSDNPPTSAPTPFASLSSGVFITSLPTEPDPGEDCGYFRSEKLPRIEIRTDGGVAPDDESLIAQRSFFMKYNYTGASISVFDCPGYEFENARAVVKVRGNSSSVFPKKPLRIKFEEKRPMCALNGGAKMKSWVLLADYSDPSLLRNAAAALIGRSLFLPDGLYCTDFRPVEVYLNGAYNGVYLLAEQQQANKRRVNIVEPKDGSTVYAGYFLEYDVFADMEDRAQTISLSYSRISPYFEFPLPYSKMTVKTDLFSKEQREFIEKCMRTIWKVLTDAVFEDHKDLKASPYHTMDKDGQYVPAPRFSTAREAIESVVNVRSLVDAYLMQEFSADPDTGVSSFFFTLDMRQEGDRLLTYTAPWDFDKAFGCESGYEDPTVSYVMAKKKTTSNPWFLIFADQAWFWQEVKARYDAACGQKVFERAAEMVEFYTDACRSYYEKNAKLWEQPYIDAGFANQKQAAEQLVSWIRARAENMEKILSGMTGG